MNDDLRNAIASICEKLQTSTHVSAAEITLLTNQLKKHTGDSVNETDHQLFMDFYAAVAVYQAKWVTTGLNKITTETALTDKMALLIKVCRELLVLLNVNNAEKAKDDFLAYANGIVNKLDGVFNLIALVEWKSPADKNFFLQEATAIYEKLQVDGWRCESGTAIGLVPKEQADHEKKFQTFLRALRYDLHTNDKYYKRPLDSMQLMVNKLESLQLKLKQFVQEANLVRYAASQFAMFTPNKRKADMPASVIPGSTPTTKKRFST
jgi:hypothetical protein